MSHAASSEAIAPPQLCECPGCGQLQTVPALRRGMTASCERCSTTLHHTTTHPLDHSIALTVAALVLLIVMCTTTLMSVQTAGIQHSAWLLSGPAELVARNMAALAAVVVFVTIVAPLAKLAGTLYVLLRLHEAAPPLHLRRVFSLAEKLQPWTMIEVFVFGVFVAYVKLGDLVQITLDAGVYALMTLTIVLIWADSALDREAIWDRLDPRGRAADRTAVLPTDLSNAIGCEVCRLVITSHEEHSRCVRCDSPLHHRKPDSLARTWALVIAAAVLYVPANYFPVLTVMQLGAGAPSTILGGVEELVSSRMYPLAALVFFASVAVPMLKLVGLTVMLVTTQAGRSE